MADPRPAWLLMKQSFLPTAERADANIAAKGPAPSPIEPVATPRLDEAEIARQQALIRAKYAAIEADRLAREPKSPTPEQLGYRRFSKP